MSPEQRVVEDVQLPPEGEGLSHAGILRAVLSATSESVVVADQHRRIALSNAAADGLTGLLRGSASSEEWAGQYGVFYSDTVTPVEDARMPLTLAAQGESIDGLKLFVRNRSIPNGVHLAVSSRPIVDESGSISGAVAVFRNISERKRFLEALRESEERYRGLVEACPDAVVLADIEGMVILCNQRAAQLHGFEDRDDVIGLNGMDFVAPEERERARRE